VSALPSDIRTLATIAHSVWRGIDWDSPLWRDRLTCYDRFTSRIVAASSSSSLRDFAAKLSSKCGVASPPYSAEAIAAMCGGSAADRELLRVARKEAGLVVSVVRLLKERSKA